MLVYGNLTAFLHWYISVQPLVLFHLQNLSCSFLKSAFRKPIRNSFLSAGKVGSTDKDRSVVWMDKAVGVFAFIQWILDW